MAIFTIAGTSLLGQEFGQGAVLLKETDRVLIGRILQRGGFYEIELAPGSRVSLPTDKVARVASSLQELYKFKCLNLSQNSVGDHFQLTRWCLSNGLLSQAAKHYAIVAQLNPNHPRVKQLGVELEEQLLRDEAFRKYLGLAPLPSSTAETKPNHIVSKETGSASAVVTASTFATGTPGYPEVRYPEVGYPELAQRFSQRVEPILLSRCSQAACHGARGTNALRLLEPYGRTHAQTTSDNLASVLMQIDGAYKDGEPLDSQQIDDAARELSPLLQYATRAHGTQPAPAIPLTESRLVQELQDWIDFVHHPVVTAVVTGPSFDRNPVRTPERTLNQPTNYASGSIPYGFQGAGLNPVTPGGVPLRSVPKVDSRNALGAAQMPTPFPASGFPVGSQPPSEAEMDALDAQLKAALGEPPPAYDPSAPVDPFDPNEFNRKTHNRQ